jgi:hypothetical protein
VCRLEFLKLEGKELVNMNGAGTLSDPYIIMTANDWLGIPDRDNKYYKLGADINFDVQSNGGSFTLRSYFFGHIDGNGKKVTGFYKRFWSNITNNVIKNLVVELDRDITENLQYYGIFGKASGNPTFEKVTIRSNIPGAKRYLISQYNMSSASKNGLFLGEVDSGCTVTFRNCCTTKDVGVKGWQSAGPGSLIASFVGRNRGTVIIEKCYTCADLIKLSPTTTKSKSFVCDGTVQYINAFYETGHGYSDTATGLSSKTQLELKNQSTFTGWDFVNDWKIESGVNDGYPYVIYGPASKIESRVVTSSISKIFSKLDFGDLKSTIILTSFMKPINTLAQKINPKYIVSSFINKINSSIGTERKATVEMKSTAGTIKSNVSSNRIATVSGSSYVRQIESEASNGRKFKTEAVAFISPLDATTQVSVKVVAKSYAGKILTDADLEGNNFKVLKVKVRKIKASATPFRNHIVVLESFVRGIRAFASTQIKDKILAKLNLNNDWTDKVIVGDTIKITLDIESKSGSQAHVANGTLKIMDSEKNVLVTYELGELEEISFGIYEVLYTIPDGYGPLYAEFTAQTDEYPIATRLKLDRQWV